MLQIYNTYTRRKEKFIPLDPQVINIYLCGVTVYDYCHIGHARTNLFFDIVGRYFKYLGYKVCLVRNITDVDDKILNKARAEGTTYDMVATTFSQAMAQDFKQLGILPPTNQPKATAYIRQMLEIIDQLLQQQYAYIGDNGDVFFKINKFTAYGALSNRTLDQFQQVDRLKPQHQDCKQNIIDFVLWKIVPATEVGWDSPWGYGRPGWHTECVAMSLHLFNHNTFDIHGGGMDLVFPHHENEMAQAVSCTGKKFVNYWMHVGFVNIDQQKMSKSLGNSILIKDLLTQYHPEVIRFFILSSHYRSPINFTMQKLEIAKSALETLYLALRGVEMRSNLEDLNYDGKDLNSALNDFITYIDEYRIKFQAAMDDDFNTSVALSILFELSKELNISNSIEPPTTTQNSNFKKIRSSIIAGQLIRLSNILGLLNEEPSYFLQNQLNNQLNTRVDEGLTNEDLEKLIAARNKARANQEWELADQIRKNLLQQGILLEDKADQTIWRRIAN